MKQVFQILMNGLAANSTYYYRVRATSTNGNSDYSNAARATTLGEVTATTMAVDSIVLSTVAASQGQKIGRAVVTVLDDQGNAVEGAEVLGTFTGTFNETITNSTLTDVNGSTAIDTIGSAKGTIVLTFCVDSIVAPSGNNLTLYTGPQICGSL